MQSWLQDTVGPVVSILSVLFLWKYMLDFLPMSRTSRAMLSPRTVVVVVLGDLSQSPRMMYHAASLARHDYYVHIVSYSSRRTLPKALQESASEHITLVPIPSFKIFQTGSRALYAVLGIVRLVLLGMFLFYALMFRIAVPPALIMLQVPPSVPTLAVVKLAAWIRGCHVIIDWHNTMHSMVALKLGASSLVTRAVKAVESFFGSFAYAHLCVSHAMRRKLTSEFDLRGTIITFYDRPPEHFHRQSASGIHAAFSRWTFWKNDPKLADILPPTGPKNSTPLTEVSGESLSATPVLRPDRPAVVVSSTSWTDDEDFDLFLEALTLYDGLVRQLREGQDHADMPDDDAEGTSSATSAAPRRSSRLRHARAKRTLPNLLVLITGQGPRRAEFQAKVAALEDTQWAHVRVRCLWLAREEYPVLLGSVDLGVSLHTSSSGVDLPMKVVDMFGCEIPVCAYLFPALPELVHDRVNGLVFRDARELYTAFVNLFSGFPENRELLLDLRHGIHATRYRGRPWNNWQASWDSAILPLLIG